MSEPDLILADVIQNELGIDPARIVVYAENWEPPKDSGIYITIQTGETQILGSAEVFDADTQLETKTVSCAQRLTVNITSRDRSALERKEEVIMALTSAYSQSQQEALQVRLLREGPVLDLSFIEGAKALHRYQVPVKIFYANVKSSSADYFSQFPTPVLQEEA